MAAAHTHSAPAPSDRRSEGRAGSRRIFPPQFKLQVLEAYRRDAQCRGNQRATARKFGIHRRQIQKWLQAEPALRAALLRRAPQPAPSPPPYSAGSPESARLPTPPPTTVPTQVQATPLQVSTPLQAFTALQVPTPLPVSPLQVRTALQVHTPLPVTVPVPVPMPVEPIDLSVRRSTPPPAPQATYAPLLVAEQPRKPFKLFRPYLLEDDEARRPAGASLPGSCGVHVSAFVSVQSAGGCALSACSAPRWCAPLPSFMAPLR